MLGKLTANPERRHHESQTHRHRPAGLPAARRPVLYQRRLLSLLCVRITPKGVKTFAFAYRNKGTGKVQWLTLGRYPDVPLARAREIANASRKTVADGGTPLTPKVERAEAEKN